MHVIVLQENLLTALTHTSRSIAARPQLPVLSHFLLASDKGRLRIAATNLEIGIQLWVGAKIDEEGAITVPARSLTEFVASLPPANVVITVQENQLTLECERHRADFTGLSASEFPSLPSVSTAKSLSLPTNLFDQLIKKVAFAAASDDARPVLTGILLRPLKEGFQVVATDGYRLSVERLAISIPHFPDNGLLIPSRALTEVAKVFSETSTEKIALALPDRANQLIFTGTEAEVTTRLLEGDFPAFEKIIPVSVTTKITFDREEMLRSVRLSSIFARDEANIIKFKISRHGGIKISAEAKQLGSSESEMEVKMTGEENQIAFNSRYLVDFLNSTTTEEVVLEMTTPLAPGVFRPVGDDNYFHLIMPVRVQE